MGLFWITRTFVFIYLVLSIIDLFVVAIGVDSNVRFHGSIPNQRLNYSYVNLKRIPGYKLNVVPYIAITVKNQSLCIKECLKTNGICKSLNLRNLSTGVHECEILTTDIYCSGLVKRNDTIHYIIAVSVDAKLCG